MATEMKCSICGTNIADRRMACSARPLNDGECCQACDDVIVTSVRIARSTGQNIVDVVASALKMHAAILAMKRRMKL